MRAAQWPRPLAAPPPHPQQVSSVFVLILLNLGRRREGEWSAYSIFNEGHRRLPGQLTAEHMDDQVRRGHLG